MERGLSRDLRWKTKVCDYNNEIRFYVFVHFSNLAVLTRDEVKKHL